MLERILLGIGALFVGLLLVYAMVIAPPLKNPNSLGPVEIDPPTDEWFQENVVQSEIPVLVDFKADWCGPCKMIHPHLVKLADDFEGRLKVVEVDIDEKHELASHYRVNSIPLVLLFVKGKIADGSLGLVEYEELQKMVEPHLLQ